jgi:hypothetical protein
VGVHTVAPWLEHGWIKPCAKLGRESTDTSSWAALFQCGNLMNFLGLATDTCTEKVGGDVHSIGVTHSLVCQSFFNGL